MQLATNTSSPAALRPQHPIGRETGDKDSGRLEWPTSRRSLGPIPPQEKKKKRKGARISEVAVHVVKREAKDGEGKR